MANEVSTSYTSGVTMYGIVFRKSDAKVWHPTAEDWETHGTGSRTNADYNAVAMTEQGASGYYIGDFPTDITTAALYDVQLREQAGATPANSDTIVDTVKIDWTGTAAVEEEVVEETVTSIANRALAKIGGGEKALRIQSINENTDISNLLQGLYPSVRKRVLCRRYWNGATKYADLGAEVTVTEKAEWEYSFNLPSDYLARCKQTDEGDHTKNYDHQISEGVLFTNTYSNEDGDSAYIIYVFNLTDVSKFSPWLEEAIAILLAAEASSAILNDKGVQRQNLIEEFERYTLNVGDGVNQAEVYDKDEGNTSWLDSRTSSISS